jgi:hypothetical protein
LEITTKLDTLDEYINKLDSSQESVKKRHAAFNEKMQTSSEKNIIANNLYALEVMENDNQATSGSKTLKNDTIVKKQEKQSPKAQLQRTPKVNENREASSSRQQDVTKREPQLRHEFNNVEFQAQINAFYKLKSGRIKSFSTEKFGKFMKK